MQTRIDPQAVTYKGWTFRLRPAIGPVRRLVLLLHGWKGDENSMWVLGRNLPNAYTVLAPRAPHHEPEGGYSWREIVPGKRGFPSINDLRPSVEALMKLVDDWSTKEGVDASIFDLAGFSQGAAIAYALTLLHPRRVGRLAALSGFFPIGSEVCLESRILEHTQIFIAHGRKDVQIPVEQARVATTTLEACGAQVVYYEADTGHKISKECLKRMERFFGE